MLPHQKECDPSGCASSACLGFSGNRPFACQNMESITVIHLIGHIRLKTCSTSLLPCLSRSSTYATPSCNTASPLHTVRPRSHCLTFPLMLVLWVQTPGVYSGATLPSSSNANSTMWPAGVWPRRVTLVCLCMALSCKAFLLKKRKQNSTMHRLCAACLDLSFASPFLCWSMALHTQGM
jgi:hypothetical protein